MSKSKWKVLDLRYVRYSDGRRHERIEGYKPERPWFAYQPWNVDGRFVWGRPRMFPTHAEAIAYADSQARALARDIAEVEAAS